MVNKSVLVSWLYSTITSGLADVLGVYLNLYWKCSIDNVVTVLCMFLETLVGIVIFPNADLVHMSFYHTIEFLIKVC